MDLQRMLDKMVLGLFQAKSSVFLSSLYCSMRFHWDTDIPTACTDGLDLRANPTWFESLSEAMRVTVLAHELWHVAYMHMMRIGTRDPQLWNMAADHAINLMLLNHGFHFDNFPAGHLKAGERMGLADWQFDGMSAEEIYDRLLSQCSPIELPFGSDFQAPPGPDGEETPGAPDPLVQAQVLAAVVRAQTMAEMSKQAGELPGDLKEMIQALLKPKLPWESLLHRWLTEKSEEGYRWERPHRRYEDMYLPSPGGQVGLSHIMWAIDTSFSMSPRNLQIINSEIVSAKEQFAPEQMTLVSFDTEIHDHWDITGDDELGTLTFGGRGGTDMHPVFELAQKEMPQALIMFSDMECQIPPEIVGVEVLWVCFDDPSWQPPYGSVVHVDNFP